MKKQKKSRITVGRISEIKVGRRNAKVFTRRRFSNFENPDSIIARNFEQITIITKELYERETKETRIAVTSQKLSIKELKSKYEKYNK